MLPCPAEEGSGDGYGRSRGPGAGSLAAAASDPQCPHGLRGRGLAVVNAGWADLDRALFGISVAAELAGLHPQTLRIYEREGLLEPARTAGGRRPHPPPHRRPPP